MQNFSVSVVHPSQLMSILLHLFLLFLLYFSAYGTYAVNGYQNFNFANHPASLLRPTEPNWGRPSAAIFVSIIIPFTCNKIDTVRATLRSLRRQTLAQHELVIINDGCRQQWIQDRLDGYAKRDTRIYVHHLVINQGLPHARNFGFKLARAHYVFMLDADDLIEPTAAEKLLWFLHSSPQLAFAKGFSVGFEGKEYLWWRGFEQKKRFLQENYVTPTVMVRKMAHTIVGGFTEEDTAGLEDWDFWLKCASQGLWGATVPEFLDWYRVRPNQTADWPAFSNIEGMLSKFKARYPILFSNFSQISRTQLYNVPESLISSNILIKKTKTLLFFVPWLRVGGADRFGLDIVRLFRRQGWGITLVATIPRAKQEWEHAFFEHSRDVFVLDRFLPTLTSKLQFIAYLMRSRQPDLVLITNSELAYVALPVIHWAAGPQHPTVVDYVHMLEPEWRNGGYATYSIEYGKYLTSTIVSSNLLKAYLRKERVTTCYIGNGFEKNSTATESDIIRKRFNIDSDTPVILYAARMVPQKRPDMVAEVFRRLATLVSFTALIVGNGPLLDEFRSNLTMIPIRFITHAPPQEMQGLIDSADIAFLPSANEGISLFAYEAMALGKVFVGADVGGQRELVTEDCGVLVERSTAREEEVLKYVEALEILVKDASKRSSMGRRARARAAKPMFRTEAMYNCLLTSLKGNNAMLPMDSAALAFRHALEAAGNMSSWAL